MKPVSIILVVLGCVAATTCGSSCSYAKRLATPANLGRALVIYDEVRRIVKSAGKPEVITEK